MRLRLRPTIAPIISCETCPGHPCWENESLDPGTHTPQKSNIDTKNCHVFKGFTFSKPSFWGSPAVSFRECKSSPQPPTPVTCYPTEPRHHNALRLYLSRLDGSLLRSRGNPAGKPPASWIQNGMFFLRTGFHLANGP